MQLAVLSSKGEVSLLVSLYSTECLVSSWLCVSAGQIMSRLDMMIMLPPRKKKNEVESSRVSQDRVPPTASSPADQ
jgi:hypothetical protein